MSLSTRAALLIALALGACTTVGPNFERPAAPATPGYAMAGDATTSLVQAGPDAVSAGPWWRALGSSQLDQVMTTALSDNQTLAAADADLQKAMAQAQSVKGSLGPQMEATAGAQRERINTQVFGIKGFPSPKINLFSIGANVVYDLDIFGKGRRQLEEAQAVSEAQARRADAAYLTLTGQVALQAVTIAGLRAEIATLGAIAADDQANIAIIHRAQAAGGEAPSATSVGEAQLQADRALIPPLEQRLAQARHALALLVGRAPAEWTAPAFAFDDFSPPATIPLSLPSSLIHHRPDILAAEADLHAAVAAVGVAQANLYPDVRLTAALTQEALTPTALFSPSSAAYNFGAGLTAPLFNNRALRADRRAAQAQAKASLARYRQTVLTAFGQVSDVLSALAQDDDRIAALSEAQRSDEAGLADARTAYRLGGGNLLAVTVAQRQLDRARLDLIGARGQRLSDIVELFAATATDWR